MKRLFIEGSSENGNGTILRKAFSKLLEKELKGKMPRIVMGDGKSQAIDKFHSEPLQPNEERFLLVDSDKDLRDKKTICDEFNENKQNRIIDCNPDNTFLMDGEVEKWILSQPEVLKKEGIKISRNINKNQKPSEILAEHYKKNGKTYTKINEFAKILPNLDTTKLKQDFPEFKALIDALK